MSKVRLRVEARRLPNNASHNEKMNNFARLLKNFKNAYEDEEIEKDYFDHDRFIRKTDKRRKARLLKKDNARKGKPEINGEERNHYV